MGVSASLLASCMEPLSLEGTLEERYELLLKQNEIQRQVIQEILAKSK